MMIVRLLLLALLLAAVAPGVATAQGTPDDPLSKVRLEQRLGEQLPLDLPFVDEAGRAVTLGDYFGEQPVALALGYYECPMLCSLVRDGMVRALSDVTLDVGSDYQVVYVSIDPAETPMNAANARAAAVSRYGRPGSEQGWHFLTGTQDSIQRLADAVGFGYYYDETIDQYAHAAGMMLATPDGTLSRYFYGVEFNASDLRLGLVETSGNTIGTPVDQLLLLCYSYDPATGKYTGFVMTLVRVVSALFVLGLVALIYALSRGPGAPGAPHGPARALG